VDDNFCSVVNKPLLVFSLSQCLLHFVTVVTVILVAVLRTVVDAEVPVVAEKRLRSAQRGGTCCRAKKISVTTVRGAMHVPLY
jgi:hypothetical protein